MAEDEKALVLCLNVLRWLGLSFTRARASPGGGLVATDSKPHLLANAILVGAFLYAFVKVDIGKLSKAAEFYKSSTFVYPLYTKLMSLTIVAFLICGNAHNRKFVRIIEHFVRVQKDLERDFGPFEGGNGRKGMWILLRFLLYLGVTTGLNVLTDANLRVHYDKVFRVVHYFCFYYVTLFAAHFALTMNYAKEKFAGANAAFRKIVQGRGPLSASRQAANRKLVVWTTAFLELQEMGALANEVFGKQVCLTLLLTFSSVIVNAYYLMSLNMHGTSYFWLNMAMWLGIFQSVAVAFTTTCAAQFAAEEANKINEMIFEFPVHLDHWKMYAQVKYFALFSHNHPVEFKAWIFYTIDYDSLLKVMLTSSAITAVLLQCEILKGSFEESKLFESQVAANVSNSKQSTSN